MLIETTKGESAVIDEVDFDLSSCSWRTDDEGYVVRSIGPRLLKRTEYIHRVIMERIVGYPLTRADEVDHKDRDKSNNRRDNLRLATRAQNMANIGVRNNNTSGYKGVSWDKSKQKWVVWIACNGKNHYVGRYNTPEEGARAYNKAARELHGEFAMLNDI